MIDSHTYTDIYLNRSLSTTGVAKNYYLRPDIIGKRIDDVFDIVEVTSESQAIGQQLNVLVSHVDFYKTVPSTEKAQKAGAKFKSLVPRSVRSWLRNTYFKLHPSTVNCNSQLTLIKLFESINPSNGIMILKGALSYAMDVNSIVTRVTINRLNQNIQI